MLTAYLYPTALIAALIGLAPASIDSPTHERTAGQSCTNWCTSNGEGTEHRTASHGVGIQDAATHGWITGDCDGHHVICGGSFASAEQIEDVRRAAEVGDGEAVRAAIAAAPAGSFLVDEDGERVTAYSCGGRVAAVIFVLGTE